MARRHGIAIDIQQGACNMIPIANELVKAIAEVREEGNGCYEDDPAVRLIVHQMAHLCGVQRMNSAAEPDYDQCMDTCERISGKKL